MKYSIFLLLALIYTIVSVISFFVIRMMRREARMVVVDPSSESVGLSANLKPSP